MHELVLLENFLLAHDLEGVHLVPSAELDEFDPAESAVAERGEYFQVVAFELPEYLFAVLLEGVQLGLLHSL